MPDRTCASVLSVIWHLQSNWRERTSAQSTICFVVNGQVHVQAVNEQNASQLPILLATKLLPEMEAQEAQLLARHAADAGHLDLGDQISRVDVSATYSSC